MNKKSCIFDSEKSCNNCGECNVCDLNPNKKCNNCGKCLEMEGYDMRAIKIDSIIEDENEVEDYIEDDKTNIEIHSHLVDESSINEGLESNTDIFDIDTIQYIDDIDGLSEILENENDFKKLAHEEYPGFIRIEKKHINDQNQSK
ncbi:hypothetical protein ACSVC9_06950 [Clostridium sp. LBM24168]